MDVEEELAADVVGSKFAEVHLIEAVGTKQLVSKRAAAKEQESCYAHDSSGMVDAPEPESCCEEEDDSSKEPFYSWVVLDILLESLQREKWSAPRRIGA